MGRVTFIETETPNHLQCRLCAGPAFEGSAPLWPTLDGKIDGILCLDCLDHGSDGIRAALARLADVADRNGLALDAAQFRAHAAEEWHAPPVEDYFRAYCDVFAERSGWRSGLEARLGRELTFDEYARVVEFRAAHDVAVWRRKKFEVRMLDWDADRAGDLLLACGLLDEPDDRDSA